MINTIQFISNLDEVGSSYERRFVLDINYAITFHDISALVAFECMAPTTLDTVLRCYINFYDEMVDEYLECIHLMSEIEASNTLAKRIIQIAIYTCDEALLTRLCENLSDIKDVREMLNGFVKRLTITNSKYIKIRNEMIKQYNKEFVEIFVFLTEYMNKHYPQTIEETIQESFAL